MKKHWKINTSSEGKLRELVRLFAQKGCSVDATQIDLKEIDSDPISVVVHKASQMPNDVLVEDTSLHIEKATVGIHIKWFLEHLSEYIGRKASWVVLLAYRRNQLVHIFKGQIDGVIVVAQGTEGFGFDPVFLPNGSSATLAISKPDSVNARAFAVTALLKGNVFSIQPVISDWAGEWQK